MLLNNQGRKQGVLVSEGQLASSEKTGQLPLAVQHAMPISFVAVQYTDDSGRPKAVLVCKAGDAYYMAPEGEQWLTNLRPLSAKLAANVKDYFAANTRTVETKDVPTSDAVSVI